MALARPASSVFAEEPSNLDRLMTVAEEATDRHATAYLEMTEAEIAYATTFDGMYKQSTEKSHAGRERDAEAWCREEWATLRRAQARQVVADKAARTALALLSAMQTSVRFESGQS